MPITISTALPGIDEMVLDPGPQIIVVEWQSEADNGAVVVDTRPADGEEWTERGSAPVGEERLSIPATPLSDGSSYDIRARVQTEHQRTTGVDRLLRLTLPVVEIAGSATPMISADGRGDTRVVEGSVDPQPTISAEVTND